MLFTRKVRTENHSGEYFIKTSIFIIIFLYSLVTCRYVYGAAEFSHIHFDCCCSYDAECSVL